MNYKCPVCGYLDLPERPEDHEICPCCGTHFGYDDLRFSHDELRRNWLAQGGRWFDYATQRPEGWSAHGQVWKAGFGFKMEAAAGAEVLSSQPPVEEGAPEVQRAECNPMFRVA